MIERILETFAHAFYDKDQSGLFISKAEAFEFAYLIIVL